MSLAIYPGSFNPWHKGHKDILEKALKCFDEVMIVILDNPDKSNPLASRVHIESDIINNIKNCKVRCFSGLLVDFVKKVKADAVIRGLRNGHDLQYEMNQQYWNEDLGLEVPVVYFICDRTLSHISSSACRAMYKLSTD